MTQQEIYNKALQIISEKEMKENYIPTCIKAGICWKCGELLLTKSTKAGDKWFTDYFCSVDKSHI